MNATIFIVTYKKDFPYLKYCLRSIEKYAGSFDGVVLLVPGIDFEDATRLVRENCPRASLKTGDEWPGKGFLWHESQIMWSDVNCPQAELIFHMDADCVWTEPVKPEDYLRDGKPRLIYESFESMNKKGIDECNKWQVCTQECLPFDVLYETMRQHPEIYWRRLYPAARMMIERKVGEKMDDWLKKQRNEFPQTFCEFNTLGNVALQCFSDSYWLYNLEREEWPAKKLHQGWGHNGMRTEDMEVFRKAGLE